MNIPQQIFVVFFAVFWGTSANVWPKWSMFHWTFALRPSRVTTRAVSAFLLLNVMPVAYFAWMLQVLGRVLPAGVQTRAVVNGVVPAFAIFGLYRLWIAVVAFSPRAFYYDNDAELAAKLGRDDLIGVEPTIASLKLGRENWWSNALVGVAYMIVAAGVPLCAAR